MLTILILAFIPMLAGAQSYSYRDLPNPAVTPGLIRTSNSVEICAPGFSTEQYRHTTEATKKKVCAEYHAKNCPGKGWEIDHLVSLEIGGEDDIGNLWAQPAPAFHEKDKLENRLHKLVCSNRMTLPAAQSCLMRNWISCYEKIFNAVPLGVHVGGGDDPQ
jgi:hypothetical protein